MVIIPLSKSTFTATARNLHEQSLGVHGGLLFNILPVDIRNWSGTKEIFKEKLKGLLFRSGP